MFTSTLRLPLPRPLRVHQAHAPVSRQRAPPLHAHWIQAEDVVVPEFLQLSMQFVCPDNILVCSEIVIPEPDVQMNMVRSFVQIQHTTNLQGLDAVVWKWIVEERTESVEILLQKLMAWNGLMHSIKEMVESSAWP